MADPSLFSFRDDDDDEGDRTPPVSPERDEPEKAVAAPPPSQKKIRTARRVPGSDDDDDDPGTTVVPRGWQIAPATWRVLADWGRYVEPYGKMERTSDTGKITVVEIARPMQPYIEARSQREGYLHAIWSELIARYKLDTCVWSLPSEGDQEGASKAVTLDRVQYERAAGVWWHVFPSVAAAFDVTGDFKERAKVLASEDGLAFAAKYPPTAWMIELREYWRRGFLSTDEVASVMCNAHVALSLSEQMQEKLRAGLLVDYSDSDPQESRQLIDVYARCIAAWTASLLGVSSTVNNMTAASPSEEFIIDDRREYVSTLPVLSRARMCPLPRIPGHSYAFGLRTVGSVAHLKDDPLLRPLTKEETAAAAKSAFKPGGTSRRHGITDANKMARELYWPAPDKARFFDMEKRARGLLVPEALFGANVLDAGKMRAGVPVDLEQEWRVLAAVALDTLTPDFLVARAYLAKDVMNVPGGANFNPAMYAGEFQSVDEHGVQYGAGGKLFEMTGDQRFFDDVLDVFRGIPPLSPRRINMFNFGEWMRELTTRFLSRVRKEHGFGRSQPVYDHGEDRIVDAICTERFLNALDDAGNYTVKWHNAEDRAKMRAGVNAMLRQFAQYEKNDQETHQKTGEWLPAGYVNFVRTKVERQSQNLALIAAAVVRCGLEVTITTRTPAPKEKKAKWRRYYTVVFGGNPACALTQYNVHTHAVFLPPPPGASGPVPRVREKVDSGRGVPRVIVPGEEIREGELLRGWHMRLNAFSWKERMSGKGEDTIVAHERGPVYNARTKMGRERSTDGKWAARWTQWRSIGLYDITEQEHVIKFTVKSLDWSAAAHAVAEEGTISLDSDVVFDAADTWDIDVLSPDLYTSVLLPLGDNRVDVWTALRSAMLDPLTEKEWKLVTSKVNLPVIRKMYRSGAPAGRRSVAILRDIETALEKLGRVFGFTDSARTMALVIQGDTDSLKQSVDWPNVAQLALTDPGWDPESVLANGIPYPNGSPPHASSYVFPHVRTAARDIDRSAAIDTPKMRWNYYVDWQGARAEVFVADVCITALPAYWRAAWEQSAGSVRSLYGFEGGIGGKALSLTRHPVLTYAALSGRSIAATPPADFLSFDDEPFTPVAPGRLLTRTPKRERPSREAICRLLDDARSLAADPNADQREVVMHLDRLREHIVDVGIALAQLDATMTRGIDLTALFRDAEKAVRLGAGDIVKSEEAGPSRPSVQSDMPREQRRRGAPKPAGAAANVWDEDFATMLENLKDVELRDDM